LLTLLLTVNITTKTKPVTNVSDQVSSDQLKDQNHFKASDLLANDITYRHKAQISLTVIIFTMTVSGYPAEYTELWIDRYLIQRSTSNHVMFQINIEAQQFLDMSSHLAIPHPYNQPPNQP